MKKVDFVKRTDHQHWVGDGFPVRTIFSYDDTAREMSPFLMMDYAGPAVFPATTKKLGVGQHPHRGFETVTIVYKGGVSHRDSSGGGGTIGPGDVQWMTAASGIIHEEFHSPEFAATGGEFEMVQLWVNLPARDKMSPPKYQNLNSEDIPTVQLPESKGSVRIIAGEFNDAHGPADTFTPMNLLDFTLNSGKKFELNIQPGHTSAIFVLEGCLKVDNAEISSGSMAVMKREGDLLSIESVEKTRFLLLSGEPIDEPVFGRGPFVMNNRSELIQAIEDFQNGRFGVIENTSN